MYLDGDLETWEALGTMSAHYSVKSILHTTATSCLAVVCLVGACSAGIISAQVDVYDLRMRGLMGALASNASDIQVTGQKTFPNPAVVAWIDVDGTRHLVYNFSDSDIRYIVTYLHLDFDKDKKTETLYGCNTYDSMYLQNTVDGNRKLLTHNQYLDVINKMSHE